MTKLDRLKSKNILLYLILFLIYGAWYLSSFPARMSPDSIAVWSEVKFGNWTDWHTLTYIFFVWVTSFFGNFLWATSLVQLVLLVIAVQHLLTSIKIQNKTVFYTFSIFLALSPWIGPFGVTIWKDIPYTALQLFSISFLIRHIWNSGESDLTKSIIFASFSILFRHNGWPTILVFTLILLLWLRKHFRQVSHLKVKAAGSLILFTFFQVGVSQIVHESSPRWYKILPIMADATYAVVTDPNSGAKDSLKIDSFAGPISQKGLQDCQSTNGFIFASDFDSRKAGELNAFFVSKWFYYLFNKPHLIVKPHICRVNNFIPPPFSMDTNYYYWLQTGIISNDLDITQTGPKELSKFLDEWVLTWEKNGPKITQPGLWWLISFISLGIALIRRLDANVIKTAKVVFAWASANSIILLTFSVAQDVRYAYPFIIPSALILLKVSTMSRG